MHFSGKKIPEEGSSDESRLSEYFFNRESSKRKKNNLLENPRPEAP